MTEVSKIYKAMVDNALVAIFLSKPDGTIIEANKAACTLFGYTEEALKQTGLNGIIDDSKLQPAERPLEIRETGNTSYELTGIRKNAERFPLEFSSSTFYDGDGEAFFSITMNDISERRQAEKEIALLINNTEEAFIVVDKNLCIVSFNDFFKNLYKTYFLRYPQKGDSILGYISPERRKLVEGLYKKVLCGSFEESELTLPSPDGTTAIFSFKYKPAKDEDGNIKGVFVSALNITDKVEAERQKELDKKDTEALINNTSDKIWSVSTDFTLIAFNNAFSDMMLAATQKIPVAGDAVFADEFGELSNNKWEEYYKRALKGEHYTVHEEIYNPVKQQMEYGLISFNPMYDGEGKVFGVACHAKDLTEFTTNQHELQNAKTRLERILESSLDVICVVDAAGFFTMVSEAANHVWGYTPAEMTGKNISDFIYPQDIEKTLAQVADIMAGSTKKTFENRYVKKDGSLVTIEWTAKWDEKTQTRYAIARDITEKKKTEELEEFEKRDKEALINSTEDLIWSVGKDYELIAANGAFIKNMQQSAGITLNPGDNLMMENVFPNEFLTFWKACYQKALSGDSFKKEVHNPASDKMEEYWSEVSFNPIYKDGDTVGIACYARNITENKLAEERLKVSEIRYRTLIEQATDAICIAGPSLRFIDVNTAGCEMTGYTKEEFLQLSITDILFAEDLITNPLKLGQVEMRETIRTERRLKRKDGSAVPVEASTKKTEDGRYIMFGHDITARKKNEENLRSSEQKYRLLFYNSPLPNWITELATLNILDVNEAAIVHYGYSKQEFLSMKVTALRMPDEDSQLLKSIENIRQTDGVFNAGIHNHRKKNGQIIMADVSCHRIVYQGKDCVTVVINDVTEREQALNKLKDREAKLETAQQIARLGYWEFNVQDKSMFWSAEIYKIWGVPNDFVPSYEWAFATIHPDDRHFVFEARANLLAGVKELNVEHRIIRADGSVKWVNERAKPEYDEHGNFRLLSGTIQDITPQKTLTLSLEESNQRYHYVTRATSDAIWDWNLLTNTIHWGDGIQHVFGYDPDIANSEQYFWQNNIHPDDHERVIQGTQRLINSRAAAGENWEDEYRFKKGNNEYAFVTDKGFVLRDEHGKPLRMVGAMQDITKRKESEEQIKRSNERFELLGKAANDAVWEWDYTTGIGWANLVHQQLYGLTLQEPVPVRQEWINRLHPDEKEAVVKSNEDAVALKSNVWYGEYKFRTEDRGWISIADRAYLEYNDAGILTRKIGSMTDITRRKQEEQHLKLLESVIINTNDVVLITDAEPLNEPGPRIVYVNDAFTRLTGYTREEIIGQSPRVLQGPKTDKKALKQLGKSLKKWERCELTSLNYKKNGEEFWNQMSITPVANEKGWFTHWIAIERDVTKNKIAELQKKLFSDTSHIFNKTADLKESLLEVITTLFDFADFNMAEIWLVSTDKRNINLAAKAAKTKEQAHFFDLTKDLQSFKPGEGLPGFVWENKHIELWKNLDENKRFLRREAASKSKINGAYGVPLLYDNGVVGVMILGFDKESTHLDSMQAIFENFGNHIGAEIKRKQSENGLNQVFNTAPDIIATFSFEGYFQRINKSGCALLEYTEEELLFYPYYKFLHAADQNVSATELKNLGAGIDLFHFENRYITKSGKTIWLSWSCKSSVEEKLIYAVAKDITEKKELEDLLNKANTLARIGGWEVDLIEHTIFWSAITCEIHEAPSNYSPTIETATDFYKEGENRDKINQYIEQAIKSGIAWDDEFLIITARGNERWVRVIGEAEMVNGKCIRLNGSFQDIDERKKAAEKIRYSNERYDMVAKATSDAIWDWNLITNQVNRVNEGYKAIFGYDGSFADADNNFWLNHVHPDDLARINHKRNNIFFNSSELYWQDEYRYLKQNGQYAWVNDRGYIIRDEAGKPTRMIGATQDITRLKENEIQLEKRARELVTSNEELEQFAYVASHDLQEPLRMVTSFLTLINKKYGDKLDDKGKKYIDFAVDGARRMRTLILDLLEFSRAGRVHAGLEKINLNELLKEIEILSGKQIAEKNATITTAHLPTLQAYKAPLRQVFQNLIGNALKYSYPGKAVTINITAIELPAHWQFAIADNGIGIAKEYFDKIFIIFQRLHLKEEYSGTGLGLAVSKKIIETMGGRIWVESEPGKGSTFYFTLTKEPAK